MPEITRIADGTLAVEVSSLGAEMQSLKTSDGRSWLWHGDPAFWGGRSPILFPIVGKAPGNEVLIDGRPFERSGGGDIGPEPIRIGAPLQHADPIARRVGWQDLR